MSFYRLLEFWGGEDWREDTREDLRRCILRLVIGKLIQQYKRSAKPDIATKNILEFWGGENWRENKVEGMQRCILRIVKEEQKRINQSTLRYHHELRVGLGEGWKNRVEPGQIDVNRKRRYQEKIGRRRRESIQQEEEKTAQADQGKEEIETEMSRNYQNPSTETGEGKTKMDKETYILCVKTEGVENKEASGEEGELEEEIYHDATEEGGKEKIITWEGDIMCRDI